MELRCETSSVMAKLMGLDKEPSQNPVREQQRVLSEEYLQKVASIGFRRKRLHHQHNSLKMSSGENEECGEALRAFKTIKRDENHKLLSENREKRLDLFKPRILGLEQQLFKGESLIDPINASAIEKSVKQGTTAEKGNLLMVEEVDSDLQRNVNEEARLYEMLRFSRSQLESKGGTFPSTMVSLKPNDGKGESSLKCFSLRSGNYSLVNGVLEDFSCHESSRSFPGINKRKNGTWCRSSEILKPVSYDDPKIGTKGLLHKYCGLRKDACLNSSLQESKKQHANLKDCSKHTNHRSHPEKSNSLLSYSYYNNCKEENYARLHKLKKIIFGNHLAEQKSKFPELSASQPSFSHSDSQIMHQACIVKDELKESTLEHKNISEQDIASHNSSIYGQVVDEKTVVGGRPFRNPKIWLSETTTSILLEDSDSSSLTSYASIQQEESEFQEDDSVYSVFSEAMTNSIGSFEEAYEPSPISVLEHPFGGDVSFGSDCFKFAGDDLYDSSEMDNDGLDFNVSSDEDCVEGSAGDLEEKQDFIGFLRAEQSQEFSYVVEVLTEAGLSNTNLYTDFSTWHSPQCPIISPSIFENLEMKFGKQPFWKRSDRMLLFDRINLALLEILQPCMCIPAWEKPVSRRLYAEPSYDMMEEQLWEMLVAQEKEAKKESADKMLVEGNSWIELRYDIEDIVRQIVEFLLEELEEEIISF